MELVSLEDILEQAQVRGIELSERTFRYYAVLGILPKPVKKAGSTDARVRFYPVSILERLEEIRALQQQGFSLKQIRAGSAQPPPEPVAALPAPGFISVELVEGVLRQINALDLARTVQARQAQEWLRRALERLLPLTRSPESSERALEMRRVAELRQLLQIYEELFADLSDHVPALSASGPGGRAASENE